MTPEKYDGKKVKLQGEFATQKDQYTDDYPKQGSELTVTGTFHVYSENGFDYYHLTDAVFE